MPNVGIVLTICNQAVAETLKQEFGRSEPAFQRAERQYAEAGQAAEISAFASALDGTGITVSAVDCQKLYENRMVPIGSSGRVLYELVLDADGGVCALCNCRDATTLDHYLPKEIFPALSFLPLNLLPACSKCNGLKGQFVPHSRAEELLHPYFDDLPDRQWVKAEISEGNPVPLFESLFWQDEVEASSRLELHFKKFRIAEVYARFAANELSALNGVIDNLLGPLADAALISGYLQVLSQSYSSSRSKNHWQAVSYGAWATSEWFLEVGRKAVRPAPKSSMTTVLGT